MIKLIKDLYNRDPISLIRYIMLIGGILVMFINLFDCIYKGRSASIFFLYVGVIFIACICLMFIHSNIVLIAIFTIFGILTMLDIPEPDYLSGGILFLIFALRINKNRIFPIFIYFTTFLLVIGTHVYHAVSPGDALNISIAYLILYLLDFILLKHIRLTVIK